MRFGADDDKFDDAYEELLSWFKNLLLLINALLLPMFETMFIVCLVCFLLKSFQRNFKKSDGLFVPFMFLFCLFVHYCLAFKSYLKKTTTKESL